ncbi:hypothetical protein ES703_75014 [subsurface metagenome]
MLLDLENKYTLLLSTAAIYEPSDDITTECTMLFVIYSHNGVRLDLEKKKILVSVPAVKYEPSDDIATEYTLLPGS